MIHKDLEKILASDEDALLASKFADNPFGQARQLTPMAIVAEND